MMSQAASTPGWATGLLTRASRLFSIPIIGTANCGPATVFAEQNFEGFLRTSGTLVGRRSPDGLYAVRADGMSMNRTAINGKRLEDGDFAIVDSAQRDARTGDVVLAVIDNKATIKRFIDDRKNGQIVLTADSSRDYAPIYLHPSDDFSISGKVVAVMKKPSQGRNKG
jgi:SOS-response transcriptional repressor LexA